MKKVFFSITALFAFIICTSGQDAAPYWSLAGNSAVTASSKLGTTTTAPLRFFTNNSERLRIDVTGRVGIGTSIPVNIFTVKTNGGTPVTSWLNGLTSPVFAGFSETYSNEFLLATASSGNAAHRSVFQGRRSRGTLAAPTVVANNDYITSLLASGYDGSTFQNPALVSFFVDGEPSAGNVPARISFVTGSNAGNRLERLKVGSTGNFNFNNDQFFLRQADGNVGFGTINPGAKLHLVAGIAGTMSFPYESAVFEKNGDNKLGVYSSVTDPTYSGSSIDLGYTNFKLSNNLYPSFDIQQRTFEDDLNSYLLRFSAIERNSAGVVAGGYINVMTMDNKGNVGINLGNTQTPLHPSANLHVIGTVKFQNLPSGTGSILVADADGNVFRSAASARPANSNDTVLVNDVNALKEEVANLKNQVEQLINVINKKNSITLGGSNSFLIYPNPTSDLIKISALNGKVYGNKKVYLQNIAGKTISSFLMNTNNLTIPSKDIPAGVYMINIYENNALLQSERVVVK